MNKLYFYTSKYYDGLFKYKIFYCYYVFKIIDTYYTDNLILTFYVNDFTKKEINNIIKLFNLYSKNGNYNFNYYIYKHTERFLNLCLRKNLFFIFNVDILYFKIGKLIIKISNFNFNQKILNIYCVDLNNVFKSSINTDEYILIT
jgi:hypothetical protein